MRITNIKNKESDVKYVDFLTKVYNPMYYNVKPRYRVPMSNKEFKIFKKAIYQLYNPEIKHVFRLKDEGITNLFGES